MAQGMQPYGLIHTVHQNQPQQHDLFTRLLLFIKAVTFEARQPEGNIDPHQDKVQEVQSDDSRQMHVWHRIDCHRTIFSYLFHRNFG